MDNKLFLIILFWILWILAVISLFPFAHAVVAASPFLLLILIGILGYKVMR